MRDEAFIAPAFVDKRLAEFSGSKFLASMRVASQPTTLVTDRKARERHVHLFGEFIQIRQQKAGVGYTGKHNHLARERQATLRVLTDLLRPLASLRHLHVREIRIVGREDLLRTDQSIPRTQQQPRTGVALGIIARKPIPGGGAQVARRSRLSHLRTGQCEQHDLVDACASVNFGRVGHDVETLDSDEALWNTKWKFRVCDTYTNPCR